MAPVYLRAELLRPCEFSPGALRFCFLCLALLGFFFPPLLLQSVDVFLSLFSLAFKEHGALFNVLIQ